MPYVGQHTGLKLTKSLGHTLSGDPLSADTIPVAVGLAKPFPSVAVLLIVVVLLGCLLPVQVL